MSRTGPVLLAAAAGVLILVGLGVWQLERLRWKEGIVAQIESRHHAPVTSLPPRSTWSTLEPEAYEYRHVAVTGAFEPEKTALVYRGGSDVAPGAGPGYLVLTPFRLPDDTVVIVNRGFVPLANVDTARSNAAPETVVVSGLMRSPETRNAFTPADQPAQGLWYTRDPAAIAASAGLARAAPFTLDLDADAAKHGWPRPGTTVIDIPNNHLSYALTWFGLAAALAGVTAVYLRGARRLAPMS